MGYVRVISYNLYHSPLTKVLLTSWDIQVGQTTNTLVVTRNSYSGWWTASCLNSCFFVGPSSCVEFTNLCFFFRVEATDTFEQKVLIRRRKWTAGTQKATLFWTGKSSSTYTSMIEFHFFFSKVYSKMVICRCKWHLCCGSVNRSTEKTLGAPIRPRFLKVNPTKQGRNSNP